VNGDGRTDLVSFPNGKLNTFLAKSDNSGTFENAILLTPPAAKFDSTRVWALDVNGDGRMDIVSYKNGKLFTYISNFSGSTGSFNSPTEFTIPASQFNPLYVWPGDYNGDGMQDLLTHEAGILYAHLSNGTGTSWTMVSTNPSGFDHTFAWVGDVNGDGLSDIVTRPTQQVYTYFAKGDGTFVTGTVYSAPGSVFGAYDTWAIDINGDGRADLLSITQSGSTVYLHAHYSKGDGTYFLVTSAKDTSTIEDPSFVWVGDFSGDGKVDVLSYVTLGPVTTHTAHINSATDRFPDLLTNITNPFSGVNTITYKPLSDGTPFYIKDTDSPCPATENPCSSTMHVQDPRYVVSNLLVKDSLGTGPDHEYSYSYRFGGARWHHLGRGNLGFRWMEEVDVSANAKTSTFYNQIFPLIGLPTNVEYDRNSDSAQFKDTVHEYWDLQAYPTVAPTLRFVAPKKVDIYERDGSATLSRTIRRVFSYDSSATGNLISTFHYGDIAVTGDEREEVTEFIPVDPIAWLHRAKTLKLKDGAGNVVREKFLYYDDQPHGVLGGAGLVTKEEANAGGGIGHAANPVFLYTNDSATGVRTNVRDPRLCDTTTVHESTKTFPQSVAVCSNITALNFVTTYEYDPRHGVVKSRTEPNRVGDSPLSTTTFDYDGFGRLTKITGPLDTASTYGTETRQYLDWGDAALQRVVTLRTEDHGTGNVIFMEEYFDGLGRIDKVRREGPDTSTSGKTIVTDALFDSQNRVTRQSAPYFINSSGAPLETPKYDLFTYDPLGRPTQVTHADNNFATKLYERGVVTLTNERGKITKQHYDGLEQLTKVQEFNSSSTYDTLYQRDAAGLLKTLTNALGHITRIDYDKLGRKRAMCDPNMGTPSNVTACLFTAPPTGAWIYTYNPAGDLMSQKDAKNQQLDFTYDELGRPKTKQQGSTVITRWTYDDAVVMHSKGRLTKVEDLPATQNTITNFTYDVLGRVTQSQRVLMGATHTMAQTYDALGRIRTETFPAPDNETVTYNYDEAGWLKSVTIISTISSTMPEGRRPRSLILTIE
jgi:YD repeat-containing protein